ncbi:right-handed parallel beta-helix repeat-containing protein [Roseobacter litoralis]|uniref:right-handed parallel beta-helix repeat-containing protein n=1 Tax=Roseobacter litoralis TaxID=42443 RepID=UPI0005C71464|nr:right-handed parallel beta-helix repeat-containing protein [Roseobacter litoralis]
MAQAGDVLVLQGGEYGILALWPKGKVDPRFPGPVTLRSKDSQQPAIFTGLRLNDAQNMVFQQILFDYRATSGSFKERPFEIKNARNIVITDSVFDGDNAHGTGIRGDGYGAGLGLSIRNSNDIRIENNMFKNFYRGLTMGSGNGNIVRGNDLSGMRSDGMNFVKVTNLLIENNYVHDFRRNMEARDHADMIQFWTNGAETPTTDIIIRGNVLNIGAGDHTQSLFMRNEAVDSQGKGRAMFYRNILIEDNVIINGHLHGISIGETDGLTIRNNTLIRAPRRGQIPPPSGRGPKHWMPRIKVADKSVNVTLQNNVAPAIRVTGQRWRVVGNLAIQDMSLMQPGHYTRVFENGLAAAPYALDNFRTRAGGEADQAGLGATRLQEN